MNHRITCSALTAALLLASGLAHSNEVASTSAISSGNISFELLKSGKLVASGTAPVVTGETARVAPPASDGSAQAKVPPMFAIERHSADLVYRDSSSRGYVKACEIAEGKPRLELASLDSGTKVRITADKVSSESVVVSAAIDVQQDLGDQVFEKSGCKVQLPTLSGVTSNQQLRMKLGQNTTTNLDNDYVLVLRYERP
ncbi:hypothetical protein KDX16_28215 [Burkholderia vietnamiensis]|uniref:hypothetical protein n=1 Tax=Burkholderia vietnamiensis TaxID=60552 RepID=UPI001B9C4B5E|nr:hypothetical protein [Burkholderia vietnamiensis]MBR7919685.1 hypothetical protein [Burkholderia vietnamiensis]MBR8205335.1 hypothetical protein [Burkholderia vietnamiensis]